jgi:hypothetical protein
VLQKGGTAWNTMSSSFCVPRAKALLPAMNEHMSAQ